MKDALDEAGDQKRGKLLEAANREYDLVRLSLSFFLFLFLSLPLSLSFICGVVLGVWACRV